MNRRFFLRVVSLLPFVSLLKPIEAKEVSNVTEQVTLWKKTPWKYVKDGLIYTNNISLPFNKNYYFIKFGDYGWNSICNGIPSKCRCHFDSETTTENYEVWVNILS